MQKLASAHPAPSKFPRFLPFLGLLVLLGGGIYFAPHRAPPAAVAITKNFASQDGWEVLKTFPHDTSAFTEGLLWHNGALYESTGLEGKSSLRRVDLESGAILQSKKLAPKWFGEGLALANGQLFQMTWQTKTGFLYDLNFKPLRQFSYQNEGWGLTFDGQNLIQSDGTDTLTFRDPATFEARKTLKVTWDGQPHDKLNELEWIDGEIWANVWETNFLVRIDPQSGKVKSYLDLTGILPDDAKTGGEDVLNGIAYDAGNKRIFVTGKNWSKLFWIRTKETA